MSDLDELLALLGGRIDGMRAEVARNRGCAAQVIDDSPSSARLFTAEADAVERHADGLQHLIARYVDGRPRS